MTKREWRMRQKMKRMTKWELYKYMSKGRTRLSNMAHDERDTRRRHESTWRSPAPQGKQ